MISYAERTIVNGSLLRDHLNKNVSIHVNVEPEAERNAKVINAKTTDDLDVQIVLNEPLNTPVKGWMEIIGVPSSPTSIRNKEVNFKQSFICICGISLNGEITKCFPFVFSFCFYCRSFCSTVKMVPSHSIRQPIMHWLHS